MFPRRARVLRKPCRPAGATEPRPYRKTPLSHEIAIGELKKYSGIQFDPEVVPILLGLDREILDRRPEGPDELPTMLHGGEPQAAPPVSNAPEGGTPPSRPALASDDVS